MIKRWKIILTAMLLFLSLPFGLSKVYGFPEKGRAGGVQSEKGPDFTLTDLQGRKFKLREQRGKPVLLIFSTTWCPSCRAEIPHLKEIYAKYTKKGVVIANIDVDETPAQVARFAEKYKLPYRVLVDEGGQVAASYHVQGVPSFTLLDKEGRFVCKECVNVEPLLDKTLTK